MIRLAALLASASLAGAAPPPKVTLTTSGHTPHVKTQWFYVVHATSGGKPARARLTAQIVDPIGGHHPVTYAASTRPVTNWPFIGTFKDYVIWPASSRGVPLTLKLVVRAGGKTKTISYTVTPRA